LFINSHNSFLALLQVIGLEAFPAESQKGAISQVSTGVACTVPGQKYGQIRSEAGCPLSEGVLRNSQFT